MDWKSFSRDIPSDKLTPAGDMETHAMWEERHLDTKTGRFTSPNQEYMTEQDKPSTPRQKLLEEAIKITTTDRNKSYGNPEDNFANIALLWTAYLDAKNDACNTINTTDVAIMMILMKCARLATNPSHHDSAVDIAGYAACLADIQDSYRKSSFMVCATSQPTKPIDGVQFPNSNIK